MPDKRRLSKKKHPAGGAIEQTVASSDNITLDVKPLRIDVHHYIHDDDAHAAALHALDLEFLSDARRLEAALATLTTSVTLQEMSMSTTPPVNLSEAIAALTATKVRSNAAVTAILAFISEFPARLQAAIDAATAAGATAEQLAELDAMNVSVSADADRLNAAHEA